MTIAVSHGFISFILKMKYFLFLRFFMYISRPNFSPNQNPSFWQWGLLLPIFGFPHKKWQNTKKEKKYIQKKSKNNRSKKRMLECRRKVRIGWGGLEIQELKFDVIFLTNESLVDKENSSWGRKVQNQMFIDSIKFYLRFKWIYGGLDCKKNWFLSQFSFLLDEIKVLGSNYNFEELICSNQGFNCIIIEVWLAN